jgi:hypothetical protein
MAMRRILTFFASEWSNTARSARAAVVIAAAVLLTGVGFSPAHSGEFTSQKTKSATTAAAPIVNCTCRYRGTDYHLGEAVCLNGPSGPRMATCGMVLNNTSWRMSETPCPSASLTPAPMPVSQISWKR